MPMQQKDVSVKSVKKGSNLLKGMTGWRKSGSVGAEKLEVLMDKLGRDWDKNLKSKPAELADHEIILGYSPMVAFKFKVVSCVQMDQRKALVLQRKTDANTCLIVQARSVPVVNLHMEPKDHGGFLLSFKSLSGDPLLMEKECKDDGSLKSEIMDIEKALPKSKLFTDAELDGLKIVYKSHCLSKVHSSVTLKDLFCCPDKDLKAVTAHGRKYHYKG